MLKIGYKKSLQVEKQCIVQASRGEAAGPFSLGVLPGGGRCFSAAAPAAGGGKPVRSRYYVPYDTKWGRPAIKPCLSSRAAAWREDMGNRSASRDAGPRERKAELAGVVEQGFFNRTEQLPERRGRPRQRQLEALAQARRRPQTSKGSRISKIEFIRDRQENYNPRVGRMFARKNAGRPE